jgi:hypothetical protein
VRQTDTRRRTGAQDLKEVVAEQALEAAAQKNVWRAPFASGFRLAPDLLDLIGRRGPRRVVLRYCDQVGILSPDTPNAAR